MPITVRTAEKPATVNLFIPTYKRPRCLRRALDSVASTVPPEAVTLSVYIIDNDAQGSGHPVYAALAEHFPFSLSYVCEPARGISHARNKALDLTITTACDFLAFLDDDEAADPSWLLEMIRAQYAYQADVVTGPVLRSFPASAPGWAQYAIFFRNPNYGDGQKLPRAGTGNVLIKAQVVRESGLRFDDRLALVGGEDELFFIELVRLGYSIYWHNSSQITEFVHQDRLTLHWLAWRSLCFGNSLVKARSIYNSRVSSTAPRALISTTLFVAEASAKSCRKLLRRLMKEGSKYIWVDLLQYTCILLGALIALIGVSPEHYKKIQGN